MRTRDKHLAIRSAKRWAEEEHPETFGRLPPEILDAVDWAKVARNLEIDWPEADAPTLEEDLQRLVDYLYEDEASDYDDVENRFKAGHIFESILAVQRWLCRRRA